MRLHFNMGKALKIIKAVEKGMQDAGLHVHGLSGDELAALTESAIQKGKDIKTAVTELGLDAKAKATAPEVE